MITQPKLSLNHIGSPYRPDIDGLRAIAILTVIIFHTFPNKMPGGFIGVDIFFVISGFLISTIILSNLEQNSFSLIEFYGRRVRRIFPALLFVLIFCLILGWFVLFPDDYTQLGKHTVAGAIFAENFVLFRESGYFDTIAESKPLLHCWSLAVEEQFYIFWPLLITFLCKRNNWSFLRIIAVITVSSFVINIYLLQHGRPIAAFYLPFARFWELMVGSALAYIVLYRAETIAKFKNTQSLLGFLLIFSGLILLNKDKDFPGYWAILPTFGALLIISAGPTTWLNRRILNNRFMVGIGLISYPLYLWHWPLLSFLHVVNGNASQGLKIIMLTSAVMLSWLTYKLIEKPIRASRNVKLLSMSLLIAMSFVLLVGAVSYHSNLFKREDERTKYVEYFNNSFPLLQYATRENIFKHHRGDCDFYDYEKYKSGQATVIPRSAISKSCFTRDLSYSHSVLLWGDSHVAQLYYGLKNNLPKNWQILLGISSGCSANPDIKAPSKTHYCDQSNWKTLQTIKSAHPDVVLVGQIRDHSILKMNHIATELKKMGVKRIIFTGPVPQWDIHLNKVIAKNFYRNTPRRTFVGINKKILALSKELVENFTQTDDVLFLNLIDFFCNTKGCLTYLGKDKKVGITTWDNGHLSLVASNKLAKELLVNKIIGEN